MEEIHGSQLLHGWRIHAVFRPYIPKFGSWKIDAVPNVTFGSDIARTLRGCTSSNKDNGRRVG